MAIFKKFEDILVWQKARTQADDIDTITKRKCFYDDSRLKNQMLGSSGSVMDNIAEGHGRGGNKEFIQYLWISNGSDAELKSQLYRSLDKKFISESEFKNLYANADEIGRMINGLIKAIKNSGRRGTKYDN